MLYRNAGVGLTRLPSQLTLIVVCLVVAATDWSIDIWTTRWTDTRRTIVRIYHTVSVEGTLEITATYEGKTEQPYKIISGLNGRRTF